MDDLVKKIESDFESGFINEITAISLLEKIGIDKDFAVSMVYSW